MKKITAFVVSCILVITALCCPVVSTAANTVEPGRETTVLNQLGFLKTIPEDLNQTVTRGEMVQIIVNMMNGNIIEPTGAVITDINEFHDYYPAMTRAIKLGLVSGPVTRPDDAVTYNEAIKMLEFLSGPRGVSAYEKQFIADRFRDKDYVPRSYFAGATPDNNYEPSTPYTLNIFENPYSRDNFNEGYLTLHVNSGGADSARQIKLRTKPSTGEWFLWEQFLLADIRKPVEEDPWA